MAKTSMPLQFILLQIFLVRPSSSAAMHELIPFGAVNGDILVPPGDDSNITNTFQSVLLTDGRYSFVRFNYHNITWTSATTSGGNASNGLGGTEAACGFNSGFDNHYYNQTNNVRQISTNQECGCSEQTTSQCMNPLIPFGADNGDIMVPQGDDSANSGRYVPKRFPLDDIGMVAPFWTDVDTREGGAIWYRQNATKKLLEEASTDIRKAFPEFPRFSAIWMFVATWEKVPFYGNKNKAITNTFQSVLLTDGHYSFVRFNYHNITWTSATTSGGNASNGLGGTEAGCGFNAGFRNYSYNVTDNGYRNISVLDLPFKTNVNKPGVWMFRTDIKVDESRNLLIPFGADNGDIMVPQGDDSTNSGKVDISTAFRFFGRKFTSLYVNINGVITFKNSFSNYVPKRFPFDDTVMIAPFWTDVDTRKGGAVWYRQNTSKNALKVASTDVRKAFPEFPRFLAIWMFVATWEKVTFYGTTNENITNTFQSVLLTDGRYSFVRFNYHNITWTSATTNGGNAKNGLGGNEAGCGLNAGFGNYSYDVTDNVYRKISVLDLPFKTNFNEPGAWMFRTDESTVHEGRAILISQVRGAQAPVFDHHIYSNICEYKLSIFDDLVMITMSFLFIQIILALPYASIALDSDHFIDYGTDSGDRDVLKDKKKINISTSFPFLGKNFTSLHVEKFQEGGISFEGATIAPFIAQYNTSKGGNVWYRENATKNLASNAVASNDVRTAFPEFSNFSAKLMVVVTWEKIPFNVSENITNTFQSVLLTNGQHSFVRFSYRNFTWTSEGKNVVFNKIKPTSAFENTNLTSDYSVTDNDYRKIKVWDLPSKTNVGKPGVWMFKTDGTRIQEPSPAKGTTTQEPSTSEELSTVSNITQETSTTQDNTTQEPRTTSAASGCSDMKYPINPFCLIFVLYNIFVL
ncbi:uncharacterized protein LOC110235594 [Exaiptasia diaphana]|uniref:NIDO domain-containing protein n=1 Tax=Exaiptasia diaphana TaxID=2652724 RepID=A0A913WZY1_EXADI|nr:uncharacterized protein LOC110235594 [Exaiptasia diaphana]